MEEDTVNKFIGMGDENILEECTKAQLQQVANNFGIRVRTTKVAEHRIEIMAQYIAREETMGVEPCQEEPSQSGPSPVESSQAPTSVARTRSERGSSGGSNSSRKSVQLEIIRMQLEAQLRREERETQLHHEEQERAAQLKREDREAQLQMRRAEIEANGEVELRHVERGVVSIPARRDDFKARERDLPTFDPLEAEAFFDHFDRIATLKE
ncbi:uncharacterized protein [Procambarus clarkii]|uniref:uncharacterized protein n=1 Tax=Procambarus clarkii TaxID=6728 RepID=UPI0037421065